MAQAREALKDFSRRQKHAIGNLGSERFLFLHMNPAAGLGNRFVALVSGFYLSLVSRRALIVDWEAYDDQRTHRSKEISTMSPLDHFIDIPFPCDASAVLNTTEVRPESLSCPGAGGGGTTTCSATRS